ncbi:MAG: 3-phosphoshikimate 1-carboxyvinyltransferase [Bacteroidales bacterium]|nr:3-phosphoshikimate 1-carboxyvinyltransferase [Bacteroidales bacterium]
MIIKILPSAISGTLHAPASKSFAQRALAAALLADGTTIIRNPSRCNDALAAMQVIQNLGATIEDNGDNLIIHGGLNPKEKSLDFGEAGLGIRLFSSIVALHHEEIILNGRGSLLSRPMGSISDALSALGASCKTNNGFLPIKIRGPLAGGDIEVDGSLSSQVLSGLIMALPQSDNDSTIRVKSLKSIPYIDMTLSIMEHFGVRIKNSDYTEFRISGKQSYQSCDYIVEGDWSGAAFLLVAGAIAGNIEVLGLDPNSSQADKEILTALQQAGAMLDISKNSIHCSKADLNAFKLDATHCPDLFPPLVALAAHCKGTSQISGVNRLIHKESNRANALLKEMGKLGISIKISGDEMLIQGKVDIQKAKIDSHNDHRIAMAAAVVTLPGKSPIEIMGADCISKSYPDFYSDMIKVGGQINE